MNRLEIENIQRKDNVATYTREEIPDSQDAIAKAVILCCRVNEAGKTSLGSDRHVSVMKALIRVVANDEQVLKALIEIQRPSVLSS